jgi:CRP-like cAMP-binding protein
MNLSEVRIPIFAALRKDRAAVLDGATQRTYAPGATLVKEGEASAFLYFIVSGTAEVSTAAEGRRTVLGPGDFFGELGLIARHPRSATVVAADELTVVVVGAWEFREFLEQHPEIAVPMVYGLVSRLHALQPHQHEQEPSA